MLNEIDQLSYTYDTDNKNLLLKVDDASNSPQGFKDNYASTGNDYSYDANGNMIADQNKDIHGISYNHLNLPVQITFSGTTNGTISYLYNALGQKVKKTVNNGVSVHTDYLSGFQYQNEVLDFFPHAEGYVKATEMMVFMGGRSYGFNYVFNYTDHLGNIRLSYSKDPSTQVLKIIEENHYYPFGLKHTGYNSDEQMYAKDGSLIRIRPVPPLFTTSYDYKYNGKELQDELSLNIYDMDMRQYDPAIARWVVQDPLVHFNYSPYFAFDNNPILWADPTGADSENGREDRPISRFAHWSDNARGVDRRENGDPSYSLVDVHAISALKGAAKLYFDNEDVSKLTEKEKQKIFETDELKTIGVLLWEFATGTGRDTRIFVYGKHPFANSYLDGSGGSITNEILSDLGEKLYKDGFRKAPKNSKEYSIALEFSPTLSPSSWGPSAAKHLTVNKVQFYIGGAVAKVRIVDGNLRGIITNETSRNSLLFHMAENYNRKDGARPLSTIIQEIQFSFPIQ